MSMTYQTSVVYLLQRCLPWLVMTLMLLVLRPLSPLSPLAPVIDVLLRRNHLPQHRRHTL